MDRIVIVGGSLAGMRAAENLRQEGFAGTVTVIGAEAHLPYDRPPLSKKFLAGDWDAERIALRKPDDVEGLHVEWLLGSPATGVDTAGQVVHREGEVDVAYDGLIVATGTRPRRLPRQLELDNVVELRTLDDSLDLRRRIAAGGRRVVIVGAGFIGLEVAATARTLGNEVLVLEGAPSPLVRGLGGDMGTAVAALHEDHGVEIRCGVTIERLTELGVELSDGTNIAADVVVVGIGVEPVTEWLEQSGFTVADGVVCDATLFTGRPNVFAAGDIVRWHNSLFQTDMRIEHWTNAAEQGAVASANLLAVGRGEPGEPYSPVPFFWSEQYDRRIQFVGYGAGADEVTVIAGSPDDRQFAALYGRSGVLVGALGVNMPRAVMSNRAAILQRASFDASVAQALAPPPTT